MKWRKLHQLSAVIMEQRQSFCSTLLHYCLLAILIAVCCTACWIIIIKFRSTSRFDCTLNDQNDNNNRNFVIFNLERGQLSDASAEWSGIENLLAAHFGGPLIERSLNRGSQNNWSVWYQYSFQKGLIICEFSSKNLQNKYYWNFTFKLYAVRINPLTYTMFT